jgi:hypothetical protein
MPAQKCLPVDEMTMARAERSASMPRTIVGSSDQKAGVMVLSSSGRFSWRWATLSEMETSKHSYTVATVPERAPLRSGEHITRGACT